MDVVQRAVVATMRKELVAELAVGDSWRASAAQTALVMCAATQLGAVLLEPDVLMAARRVERMMSTW